MKNILKLFYGLFFIGFTLKLFHIHYNAILMLLGLGGIFIITLVRLFRKEKGLEVFQNLIIWLWLLLIFLSIKFLTFQKIVLIVAAIATLLFLGWSFQSSQVLKSVPIVLLLIFATSLYLLPTHERYKIFNINWNHEIESDYITWDKYSWFLYQNRKFEEALQASIKAKRMAGKFDNNEWVNFIEGHRTAIELKNWVRYR